MIKHLPILLVLFGLTGQLFADDIKLKSGKVLKDVEVLKDDGEKLRIRHMDGRSARIVKADIAEHIKKETPAQILRKKEKALGKKDYAGMLELGRWGMEQGAKRDAIKLLNKVIKKQKNNEEARALLGHELVDGKWMYGKKLERYLEKKRSAELEARGWVKVKGEWVEPFAAKNLSKGLIERDGEWYSKAEIKRLDKGEFYLEGQWYAAGDKARLDAGERRHEDEWKKVSDLNQLHRNPDDPWNLMTRNVRLIAMVNHRALSATLAHCEETYRGLRELFNDGPVTAASPNDRMTVLIVKDLESYRSANDFASDSQRGSSYSSATGVFYAPSRGQAFSFYHSEEFLRMWTQEGIAHAFMGALGEYDKLASPMVEAIGAYFAGYNKGKFQPVGAMGSKVKKINSLENPSRELRRFDFSEGEDGFARIGFVFHYLMKTYPEEVKAWVPGFLHKGWGRRELFEMIEKSGATEEQLKEGLNAELNTFKSSWRGPK